MLQTSAQIESFLRAVADGLQAYDPHWLNGPVQFSVTGSDADHWFLAPPAARSGDHAADRVELVHGRHPDPRWTLACSPETMLEIAERRFPFRDPSALLRLEIAGDLLELREKLSPFLYPTVVRRLLARFRLLEGVAARLGHASQVREVRRFDRLSVEAIEWAAERLVPVVFDAGLADWPVWRWSFDSLAQRGADIAHYDYLALRQITLAEAIRSAIAPGKPEQVSRNFRVGGLALPRELSDDLVPDDLAPLQAPVRLLWFGAANTLTALHRDAGDVLNFQVIGRKHWRLYSPDQADRLYVQPPVEGFQQSRVDLAAPDATAFPRFAEARAIELVLEPGQLLFNPAGWFHEVRSLDPAVSVSLPLLYPSRVPSPGEPAR